MFNPDSTRGKPCQFEGRKRWRGQNVCNVHLRLIVRMQPPSIRSLSAFKMREGARELMAWCQTTNQPGDTRLAVELERWLFALGQA